jgi:hypothetical protein
MADPITALVNDPAALGRHLAQREHAFGQERFEASMLKMLATYDGMLVSRRSMKAKTYALARQCEAEAACPLASREEQEEARKFAAMYWKRNAEDHAAHLELLQLEKLALERALQNLRMRAASSERGKAARSAGVHDAPPASLPPAARAGGQDLGGEVLTAGMG